MTLKCGTCAKFTSADGVKCRSCGLTFHRHCANISSDSRPPTKWLCKSCTINYKAKVVTPQFCSSGSSTDPEFGDDAQKCTTPDGNQINLTKEIMLIRSQLSTIVTETSSCRQEMAAFRQEVLKLNTTVADLNKRLNTVEEKVNNIASRLTEAEAKIVVVSGVDITAKIERHLNDRDQESFSSDLEITGIDEIPGENPVHLVTLVGQKVGISLNSQEIVSAERRGKRRDISGDISSTPHPRTLVVRMARRDLRDQLIRAARTRRGGADTVGIVTTANTQPRRFYINERLTWFNRQLFREARKEGRLKGFKYVWTQNGRIFARRDSDSPALRIRSESDIEKVFSKV